MDPDTSKLVCLAAEVAVLLSLALVLALVSYTRLVRGQSGIEDSWGEVDTELRRRYELIPKMATIVQVHAACERGVLDRLLEAQARAVDSTGSPSFQAVEENALVRALREVLAVAEGYPQLKADGEFQALQKELADAEERIQAARRLYNAEVRDYNGRCHASPSWIVKLLFRLRFMSQPFADVDVAEVLPSGIVAWMFDFRPAEYFEIEGVGDKAASEAQL